jgi:NAD(P)-dependent dehydrogenase (short-subunit alcohol dehydrogenase family)
MPTPTLLVTGSSGLIGSEVCVHFAQHAEQAIPDANPHWIALSA